MSDCTDSYVDVNEATRDETLFFCFSGAAYRVFQVFLDRRFGFRVKLGAEARGLFKRPFVRPVHNC
jgi:hypothetical protein